MKTSIDIPDDVFRELVQNAKAPTKRQAILTAIEDYNRKFRQRSLLKYLGTSDGFISQEELMDMRMERGKYSPKEKR